jgi:hypothetical protein
MSIEMFKELTNAQLKEECEAQGIKSIPAKKPGQPNKDEYLAAITSKLSYGADVAVEGEPKDEKPVVAKAKQTPAQLARLEAFRKDRVTVHDVQENQSKDKDELLPVSWGNLLLGGQTDMVALNGAPQYLRRGAINNLLEAYTTVHKPKPNGNGVITERVKRFIVTPVTGLTEAELAELGRKQSLRNSKYA